MPAAPEVEEMTWALLLGGPLDGRRLPVRADQRTYVASVTDNYHEEQLTRGETSRIRLFVHSSLTPAKALAQLIAGYPRN